MILFRTIRRYLPLKAAMAVSVLCYALMFTLIIIAISQIGADLRYANI